MASAKKVGIGVGVVVAVVFAVLIAASSTMTSESSIIAANDDMLLAQNMQFSEAEYAHIGETVKLGDLAYTFTDIGKTSRLDSQADGVYLIIYVTVENQGMAAIDPTRYNSFTLIDDQDRTFTTPMGGGLEPKDLNPGIVSTDRLAFDVPVDKAVEYALIVSDADTRKQQATIWIGTIPSS